MTYGYVIEGDNLPLLEGMSSKTIDLIYIDPPFNTGRMRVYSRLQDVNRIEQRTLSRMAYNDSFADYNSFLRPRLEEAYRVLTDYGSLYLHIDYRESAHVRLMLEDIFGPECLMNEIIWAYDYGAKPKNRWPTKHDTIYWFVKDPQHYTFNRDEIDREPYMTPGLVGPEKAARGKLPTDVWWHSIVGTNSHERTGYPTQKPRGLIDRIIKASSNPGDTVVDFFAGSGTVGESCAELDRNFVLIDNNPEAIMVMRERLSRYPNMFFMPGV